MATLTVQEIDRDGVLLSLAAADAAGDQFENDGDRFLAVYNNSGGDVVVSAVIQKTVDKITPDPKQVTVGDGQTKFLGRFPTDIYNDTNGYVQITYDSATDVSVAVYTL